MGAREIPLTKGKVALVDEEDYERLSAFKWCASLESRGKKYYAIRRVVIHKRSFKIRMHRFLLGLPTGFEDPRIVDHINDDSLDNRKSNLQILDGNEANMAKVARWKRKDTPYL